MGKLIELDAAQMQGKFLAIAAEGQWQYRKEEPREPDDSWALKYANMAGYIKPNGTNAEFKLIYNPDGGRIAVRLTKLPRYRSGCISPSDVGMQSPDITVAFNRSPAAIAADIKRRFIPEWEKVLAALQAKADEWNEYHATKDATRARLVAKIEGASIPDHMKHSDDICAPSPYYNVRATGPESVSVEVRYVGIEFAEAIIDLVEAYRKAHPDD